MGKNHKLADGGDETPEVKEKIHALLSRAVAATEARDCAIAARATLGASSQESNRRSAAQQHIAEEEEEEKQHESEMTARVAPEAVSATATPQLDDIDEQQQPMVDDDDQHLGRHSVGSSANAGGDYELTELKAVTVDRKNDEPSDAVVVGNESNDFNVELVEEASRSPRLIDVIASGNGVPASHEDPGDDFEDAFKLRLVGLVKREPALFDPLDDNFGSRRGALQYRNLIWNHIVQELGWNGTDQTPLSTVWRELNDKYTKKRKDELTGGASVVKMSKSVYEAMRFLDPYIPTLASHLTASTSSLRDKDVYYEDRATLGQDVMISGYKPLSARGRLDGETLGHANNGFMVMPLSGGRTSRVARPSTNIHRDDSPDSSGPSRSFVLSPPTQPPRRYIISPKSTSYVPNIVHGSSSATTLIDDGTVQVTASGTAGGMVGQVKKEGFGSESGPTTMLVDTNVCYQNGAGQKMFRLFTMSGPGSMHQQQQQQQQQPNHHHHQAVSLAGPSTSIDYDNTRLIDQMIDNPRYRAPPRKKMAIAIPARHGSSAAAHHVVLPSAQSLSHQSHHMVSSHVLPAHTSSSSLQSSSLDGDDDIIDDGIQENTVVIDPDSHLNEVSPLLGESSELGSLMISGHQSVPQRGVPGSMHHSLGRRSPDVGDSLLHHQPQSQYDADLQFQQLISSHLSRLNEDEKAVVKFQVQRILLDARFGTGTAKNLVRNCQDEDAEIGVVSHEMVGDPDSDAR